jgi:hypothetical protein
LNDTTTNEARSGGGGGSAGSGDGSGFAKVLVGWSFSLRELIGKPLA